MRIDETAKKVEVTDYENMTVGEVYWVAKTGDYVMKFYEGTVICLGDGEELSGLETFAYMPVKARLVVES